MVEGTRASTREANWESSHPRRRGRVRARSRPPPLAPGILDIFGPKSAAPPSATRRARTARRALVRPANPRPGDHGASDGRCRRGGGEREDGGGHPRRESLAGLRQVPRRPGARAPSRCARQGRGPGLPARTRERGVRDLVARHRRASRVFVVPLPPRAPRLPPRGTRAPPGALPPVAGRNEQFRPALRTRRRRRPGAFFSSSQSLSTDRIRFFSTHASPPIHPPPPRPRLQGILDRNKVLIHEINRAHHTYPWDVHRAAERIRELNANLGKVQELYEEATGGFNAAALSNRRDIRASE